MGQVSQGGYYDVELDAYVMSAPLRRPWDDPDLAGGLPAPALALLKGSRPQSTERFTAPTTRPSVTGMDRRVTAWLQTVGTRAEGDRSNTAFKVAGWLRRNMAIEEAEAWQWMTTWNQGNVPPLAENELRECFDNGLKYGTAEMGCALVEDRWTAESRSVPTSAPTDGDLAIRSVPEEAAPRFRLLSTTELAEIVPKPPLVQGVLEQGGMSAIIAPYSTFKSFIALGVDLSIAHGFDWYDYRVTPGLVVYQAGEGASGILRRVEAWRAFNQIPEGAGQILFLPQTVKLNDKRDLTELLSLLRGLPDRPIKFTVDTFARSLRGNENAAEDTGLFVEACDAIREEIGAHVQLVHHTGWEGTRSRGSSNMPASLDTEMTLTRDGERVTITCTKQKDQAEFPAITLESVPIAGSLAFMRVGPTAAKLSNNERRMLEVVQAESNITATTWKTRSGIAHGSFYNALNRLKTLGYVKATGNGYTITEVGQHAP